MKKIILFSLSIILIIIVILIMPVINKEKILIEDKWINDNHYVGMILTSKGNIYYIDNKFKNDSSLNNSEYLLNHYKRKESKINYQDLNNIKKLLKEIKNNYNSICEYNNFKNNDRILIYHDNKKIILAGNKNCQQQKIINIIQKYGMWLSDN